MYGSVGIFAEYENLYGIFKIAQYAICKIKERTWLYGYDFENNWPLQKFQRADGGKQRVAEHPAQFGLWPAGAERGR